MRFNIAVKLKNIKLPVHKIWIFSIMWLVLISLLHYELNIKTFNGKIIKMGYMPVVTNLSAPILDHISKTRSDVRFEALKFASFADMAEAFKLDAIQAAFMIAPLSIVLYEQGTPLKVVYIGNRNESTLVARKDEGIKDIRGFTGRKVAVPLRYSGHNLFLYKLAREKNIDPSTIDIVEMQPPDMASALMTGDLDGYCVGEPFAAQTLSAGHADLVYYVEEKWPGFICNLVVLKEDFIENEPDIAASFIKGLVRSGIWAKNNLPAAVQIASKYWNRHSDIVEYAFTTPKKRINFDMYAPKVSEMQEISDLMYQFNFLKNPVNVSGLLDTLSAASADTANISLETIFIK